MKRVLWVLLTFKIQKSSVCFVACFSASGHLSELITPYQPNRTLRSRSDIRILTKPQTRYSSSAYKVFTQLLQTFGTIFLTKHVMPFHLLNSNTASNSPLPDLFCLIYLFHSHSFCVIILLLSVVIPFLRKSAI